MRLYLVSVWFLIFRVSIIFVSAENNANHHDETMEEFFDLDDVFGYHVSDSKDVPSLSNNKLGVKISIQDTITTTTKPTKNNDVKTDTDDEDAVVISGAGSGSGMDEVENQQKTNETVLTFLDSEGVQLNSGEGKSKEPGDFILTGTTLPSKATTQTDIVLDHTDNEEGAADGNIINWARQEKDKYDDDDGGDEDDDEDDIVDDFGGEFDDTRRRENELVSTTLPPSYVQSYVSVKDRDPCDKKGCYYSSVCVNNNGQTSCVCQFNCTDADPVDVCGSDTVLYPNDCSRRLASCEQQRNIEIVHLKGCSEYRLQHPELPTCNLVDAPRWSYWSPWIRHGDVNIRIRSCNIPDYVTQDSTVCEGPRIEAKACNLRQIGRCRDGFGNETRQMKFSCDGIDIKDTENADLTFGLMAHADECRYSLFDLTRKKAVFTSWNLTRIVHQGGLKRWCHRPHLYIMSHTSLHSCKNVLVNLCKQSRKCKHIKETKQRNLGDFAHNCWNNFLFGNRIPAGISDTESRFSFICQRFAPDSSFGKVFGHKNAYYGTIYDTHSRIPVVSLATIKSLGDDLWPDAPSMVEHGLFEEDSSLFWLFKNRKRGMVTLSDLKRCELDWQCEMGKKQALPIDYQHSGYRMSPLIWPELIGFNIDAKISTFTLTNMAAMHPSLYPPWRNAIREIRRYAELQCKVPVTNKLQRPYVSLKRSSLHLASGAVASRNPKESIGNDVNVPFMFWMAGCCVRNHEVKSFAIYARNVADSRVISSSVLQLETLLQDIYRVKARDIGPTIFPGNEGMCGNIKNDDSHNLVL